MYLGLNAKKLCNILQYQLTDSILDHISNYSK